MKYKSALLLSMTFLVASAVATGIFIVNKTTDTTRFVKIHPENGTLEFMMAEGELFNTKIGTTETYFISFIKETSPFCPPDTELKMEQGFIVVKLHRPYIKEKGIAYAMLDSLNECRKSFKYEIDVKGNNWPDSMKIEIRKMREADFGVRHRFFEHIAFNIEPEALKTGISNKAFLTYE